MVYVKNVGSFLTLMGCVLGEAQGAVDNERNLQRAQRVTSVPRQLDVQVPPFQVPRRASFHAGDRERLGWNAPPEAAGEVNPDISLLARSMAALRQVREEEEGQ